MIIQNNKMVETKNVNDLTGKSFMQSATYKIYTAVRRTSCILLLFL